MAKPTLLYKRFVVTFLFVKSLLFVDPKQTTFSLTPLQKFSSWRFFVVVSHKYYETFRNFKKHKFKTQKKVFLKKC